MICDLFLCLDGYMGGMEWKGIKWNRLFSTWTGQLQQGVRAILISIISQWTMERLRMQDIELLCEMLDWEDEVKKNVACDLNLESVPPFFFICGDLTHFHPIFL